MKKYLKRLLALALCLVMLTATATTALAADIPYKNYKTTGTGNFSFTIDTSSFSGYSSTTIGHFTVQTTSYSSSSYITVTVYYGNTAVGYALLTGNQKSIKQISENVYFTLFAVFSTHAVYPCKAKNNV